MLLHQNRNYSLAAGLLLAAYSFACPVEGDGVSNTFTPQPDDKDGSQWVYSGDCSLNFFLGVNYIDNLVEFSGTPLNDSFDFDKALGPPTGTGTNGGSLNVFVIGDDDYAVFEKEDYRIVNGDGIDFKVFENGFYSGGDPDINVWDLATVEVSQDGDTWVEMPYTWDESAGGFTTHNLVGKDGLVGLHPTIANCEDESQAGLNLASDEAGGDGFDLADVGLEWIRYIKVVDSGYEFEDMEPAISNGVDIDSIALFNVVPEPLAK